MSVPYTDTGPTIGQKLAMYKAKRTHVADIKEPLVRALWWRNWEQHNINILREHRSMPSEYGPLMESAEEEIQIAREARRKILMLHWAMRVWGGNRTERAA